METPAEKTLAERWLDSVAQAESGPGPQWLQQLGTQAAQHFRQSGLPDRKVEGWKYTPLRILENLAPELSSGEEPRTAEAGYPPVLSDQALRVDLVNGRLAEELPAGPPGVTLLPLDRGVQTYETQLRPLLESLDTSERDDAFKALNSAQLRQGLVLHVAAGVDAGEVLLCWTFSGESGRLGQSRVLVLLEAGAQLELLEHYQSIGAGQQALNVVVQAELAKGAKLDHLRVQNESEQAVLLTSAAVQQAQDSCYRHFGFDLGGGLVRHETEVVLNGTGATTELNGAFVLDGKRHVDNHVSVDHASPGCTSEQFYRGVLGGRSRGVFNGRTLIQAGADDSSVKQSNANLLLSPLAEMDTKPELEIYADEVVASHGATVGQLDELAVFYLRSRGLSDMQARRMLTAAFCHAVTGRLHKRELADQIAVMIDDAMPDGHSEEN